MRQKKMGLDGPRAFFIGEAPAMQAHDVEDDSAASRTLFTLSDRRSAPFAGFGAMGFS